MSKTKLARIHRRNPTPEEAIVWHLLRRKNLYGLKFRRQHPIQYGNTGEFFIVDFCCPSKMIIIELDGAGHLANSAYDLERDKILKDKGYKIYRIYNSEARNIDKMEAKLRSLLSFRSP